MLARLYELTKPVLFKVDPETAHERAVELLRTAPQLPGGLALLGRLAKAPDRPTVLAGIKLKNPIGLAAGFDKNAELVPAIAALGFGYVEVGTLTWHAQPGNPRPRLFRYPEKQALVNRLGFNNIGVANAARHLERLRDRPIPIGINIGKSAKTSLEDAPAEYALSLERVADLGDYFTLNISSPNTADLRKLHEPARLAVLFDAIEGVRQKRKIDAPIFLKVSPDAENEDLVTVALAAKARGFGLIATNTTIKREGELASLEAGGLSGAPLRDRAGAVAKLLRETVGKGVPLIAAGGIDSKAEVAARLAAGADALQIYTAFVYGGPTIVSHLLS